MKWISFVALMPLISFALPVKPGENFRVQIPGEYIVKASNTKSLLNIKRRLGKDLYLVKANQKSLVAQMGHPNYAYYGNYMEASAPNDEHFSEQYHHTMIQTTEAWTMSKGSEEIIVAVTDNEFDMEHDDLVGQWWVNEGEIAGNGIDDDGNGYVDDVNGWDFVGQDNELGADTSTHGTHVAGIIAAKANNGLGGAGIAPNVKVMPLRWYGDEAPWTSATIAETYRYAVDHGAKIINTSYNVDGFVDDQVYLETVRYVTEKGAIIFNSAGNSGQKNPARQKIEELVLVCSVKSGSEKDADKKSSFSNYGKGIDICAPGDPIYAPIQGRFNNASRYGTLSGTSMASPVAAAVAALIWSHNPNFSAEEVKQRLFESADDIEGRNWFWYKGLLGAGRVNAFKALK